MRCVRASSAFREGSVSVAAVGAICVRGLLVDGVHGVLPEERSRPQPFRVEIELDVDLEAAAASDDLADTVDYSEIADRAASIVADESFRLLEALAQRICDVCLDDGRVRRATVEVTKLRPPIARTLDGVSVRLSHSRS